MSPIAPQEKEGLIQSQKLSPQPLTDKLESEKEEISAFLKVVIWIAAVPIAAAIFYLLLCFLSAASDWFRR